LTHEGLLPKEVHHATGSGKGTGAHRRDLWRYDQYIANAEGRPALKDLWRDLKCQEIDNINRMKQLLVEEIQQNCF
jgi:hypothetical protein